MGVHRLTDAAELALQAVSAHEHKKPSEVLSQLIIDYHRGLTFEGAVDIAAHAYASAMVLGIREQAKVLAKRPKR